MTVLLLAAAMKVMAVDYTATAVLTLTASPSGQTCEIILAESASFDALDGAEMDMDGRKVALYGIKGAQKLQIIQASDLTNVRLGLLTDASTSYTIAVSSVAGTPLYLHDYVTGDDYALTEGASHNFTATASVTDETRFLIKKTVEDKLKVCFIGNLLSINDNPYVGTIVIKDANGDPISGSPFAANTTEVDFTSIGTAGDRFTVEFAGGLRKLTIIKE